MDGHIRTMADGDGTIHTTTDIMALDGVGTAIIITAIIITTPPTMVLEAEEITTITEAEAQAITL